MAWLLGNLIQLEKRSYYRKIKLTFSIIILILPLIYYKYFNFILSNIFIINFGNSNFDQIPLPIGISFITFTVIAYLVEVYKERYLT